MKYLWYSGTSPWWSRNQFPRSSDKVYDKFLQSWNSIMTWQTHGKFWTLHLVGKLHTECSKRHTECLKTTNTTKQLYTDNLFWVTEHSHYQVIVPCVPPFIFMRMTSILSLKRMTRIMFSKSCIRHLQHDRNQDKCLISFGNEMFCVGMMASSQALVNMELRGLWQDISCTTLTRSSKWSTCAAECFDY